jgi:hypothetical protein
VTLIDDRNKPNIVTAVIERVDGNLVKEDTGEPIDQVYSYHLLGAEKRRFAKVK